MTSIEQQKIEGQTYEQIKENIEKNDEYSVEDSEEEQLDDQEYINQEVEGFSNKILQTVVDELKQNQNSLLNSFIQMSKKDNNNKQETNFENDSSSSEEGQEKKEMIIQQKLFIQQETDNDVQKHLDLDLQNSQLLDNKEQQKEEEQSNKKLTQQEIPIKKSKFQRQSLHKFEKIEQQVIIVDDKNEVQKSNRFRRQSDYVFEKEEQKQQQNSQKVPFRRQSEQQFNDEKIENQDQNENQQKFQNNQEIQENIEQNIEQNIVIEQENEQSNNTNNELNNSSIQNSSQIMFYEESQNDIESIENNVQINEQLKKMNIENQKTDKSKQNENQQENSIQYQQLQKQQYSDKQQKSEENKQQQVQIQQKKSQNKQPIQKQNNVIQQQKHLEIIRQGYLEKKSPSIFQGYQEDTISEEEFYAIAKTGDLLLFETNNFGAKMQRQFTGSKYDHVGICVKFGPLDLRVFDSNFDDGVAMMDWDDYIRINNLYSKVAIRQLVYDRKEEIVSQILDFIGETIGKRYQLTIGKLIKQDSIINEKKEKQVEGYFCSELVAKLYKRLGFLPKKKSSCQYWPVSFTDKKDLQLLNSAKLSNEVCIVLNKHRKKSKDKN